MIWKPEQLVSDNGPQLVSDEFQAFMKSNGIRHTTSAYPSQPGNVSANIQTSIAFYVDKSSYMIGILLRSC